MKQFFLENPTFTPPFWNFKKINENYTFLKNIRILSLVHRIIKYKYKKSSCRDKVPNYGLKMIL